MTWSLNIVNRVILFWFQPVHAVRLDAFTRLFSITFLIYMVSRFLQAKEWLTAYGFHITSAYKAWYHINPFPLLPDYLVTAFGIILFGSTLALIIGWKERIMIWLVLACAVYVQNVDVISAFTLNKLYIVFFTIIALSSKPREVHADKGKTPVRMQSAWPLRIIQATLIIHYFTAGICKITYGDWIFNPYTLWAQVQGVYCTDFAAWLLRNLPKPAWGIMQYAALSFEVFAAFLFTIKRLRKLAILWGICFHLLIAATMYQLIYFSAQMISIYVVFLDDRNILSIRNKLLTMLYGVLALKRKEI